MLEKLIWISAFMLVGVSYPGVEKDHCFEVRGIDYKTVDGTCIRDYIDVTDLADAHVKALEKALGIYNVGTGRGRSVNEFVKACKEATAVNIKVDFLPRRPGDYAKVFSDPSKILRELNWSAQYTDIEKSLRVVIFGQ